MPDWWPEVVGFAEKFGLPVVILYFVLKGLAKIIVWVGQEIVVPMRDGSLCFLKRIEKGVDALESNTEKQAQASEKIAECMMTHNNEDIERHREVMTEFGTLRLGPKVRKDFQHE